MRFLSVLLLFALGLGARADEPFLKPNDVVALVGGEDMVVANELGLLETQLQRLLPTHRIKVRCFAWEGDTVFEQRRDLNYPPLETQLDKAGATVVFCQFGQMESLAGPSRLGDFTAAYEKLIARLSAGGKRRLVLVAPTVFEKGRRPDMRPVDPSPARTFPIATPNLVLNEYKSVIKKLAASHRFPYVGTHLTRQELREVGAELPPEESYDAWPTLVQTRDGVHAAVSDHVDRLMRFAQALPQLDDPSESESQTTRSDGVIEEPASREALRQLIVEKNRLWFQYTRPQNWAFLAGDRTNQPSSRDHLDKNKRWFPEEMEQFVPLIEAKEKEIWEAAAKLKGNAQ